MSEYINNSEQRKEVLKRLIRELHEGKSVEEVRAEFARLLQDAGASEIAAVEQALIAEGMPESEVKRLCDVHVAVFREALEAQPRPETIPGHPVQTFRAENAAVVQVLEELGRALSALKASHGEEELARARAALQRLREYEKHYLRKENLLFPFLEKHGFSGPSRVMWAIHDDIRAGWKALDALLAGPMGDPEFDRQLDRAFLPLEKMIREMIVKEENILFPTSLEKLSHEEWLAIRDQERTIGYCYVEPGDQWPPRAREAAPPAEAGVVPEGRIPLHTGALSPAELNLLFRHLPVDITFVDKDDRVRFFSQTRDRIFPRAATVIGRQVQQCHPPASIHKVQQILDDFRAGRRDHAEFWIRMRGRFIYIVYYAVRDENGEYQGTLEVIQDIGHLRELQGERRLLED
ncbi:MAG: DUF438 domain-containing protein [Chloroflexia bacterium]